MKEKDFRRQTGVKIETYEKRRCELNNYINKFINVKGSKK